jgi:hypothetical protein
MTLQARIEALYTAIAVAINADRTKVGALSGLVTTNQTSIVEAINEVSGIAQGAQYSLSTLINDTTPGTSNVFSSQEVVDRLVALKDEILGGASPSYDTLLELQEALEGADVTGLLAAIGNRVRFDAAQTLDTTQQQTARDNIGAASAADLSTLTNALGAVDTDFAAAFDALLV